MGSETRFSWKFSGQIYMVFCRFSLVSLTELWSFWYGLKDLFTLHKSADKVIFNYQTDDVTSGRKDVDPHKRSRRLRGEWVKLRAETRALLMSTPFF